MDEIKDFKEKMAKVTDAVLLCMATSNQPEIIERIPEIARICAELHGRTDVDLEGFEA